MFRNETPKDVAITTANYAQNEIKLTWNEQAGVGKSHVFKIEHTPAS